MACKARSMESMSKEVMATDESNVFLHKGVARWSCRLCQADSGACLSPTFRRRPGWTAPYNLYLLPHGICTTAAQCNCSQNSVCRK
mmetsp:Transcript_12489/g.23534  ORF Transcript_12489/g.23534 Transcript_12489/m.23534 type:complete len:86 (-) Transcript_12489:1-258(-)